MDWADEITLITPAYACGTNEHGFNLESQEESVIVFANKKSVGQSEFYKAAQAGYSAELKFNVKTIDYDGQPFVEYDGKRYKVLRSYLSKNGEETELTLTDIAERSIE